MCRSVADGGQRCAAHTRAAFEAVDASTQPDSPVWVQAAADYASTREGALYFDAAKYHAKREERYEDEARLTSVLAQGETKRKVNDESRLRIIEATTQAPTINGKATRLVGDTYAFDDADQVHKVFRPYDRRINNVRYVQEPDGTLWSVNKHGVVSRKVPSSVLPGWSDLEFAESDTSNRLKKVASDVDLEFKRCVCC